MPTGKPSTGSDNGYSVTPYVEIIPMERPKAVMILVEKVERIIPKYISIASK